MSLIVAKNYDPASITTKSTAAALAMTAIDTTNLRNTFTATTPAVLVRMQTVIQGATTYPQILMGVLSGAAVMARSMPKVTLAGTSGVNTWAGVESLFVVSGLTPGQNYSFDAAYGVEFPVASSAIKYGGGDDATTGNAFGAFIFEIWEA